MNYEEELIHYQKIYPDLCQDTLTKENFAEQLYTARRLADVAETIFGLLLEKLDIKIDYEDIRFDYYDYSFELKGVKRCPGAAGVVEIPKEILLTSQQQSELSKLGFKRCWICFKDGTENYYSF